MDISILGSCVSRDAIEFLEDFNCNTYIARSSLVSIFSQKPTNDELKDLQLKDCHLFHEKCILNDINKEAINLLPLLNKDILIVDFIEERVPLGKFNSGAIVTLSQASRLYSNLDNIVSKKILPFSDEHLEIFKNTLKTNSSIFDGLNIILHTVYYADDLIKGNENLVLQQMYTAFLEAVPHALLIEPSSRISNPNHKWGGCTISFY